MRVEAYTVKKHLRTYGEMYILFVVALSVLGVGYMIIDLIAPYTPTVTLETISWPTYAKLLGVLAGVSWIFHGVQVRLLA